MILTLPRAPDRYDALNEQQMRGILEQAFRLVLALGMDIDLGSGSVGLILISADGTRWRLTIGNDGALTTVSL